MAFKSNGRKLSFDVLSWTDENDDVPTYLNRSYSDPPVHQNGVVKEDHPTGKKKRNRKKKNKKLSLTSLSICENSVVNGNGNDEGDGEGHGEGDGENSSINGGGERFRRSFYSYSGVQSSTVTVCEEEGSVKEPEASESNGVIGGIGGELRQRNVNVMKGGREEVHKTVSFMVDECGKKESSSEIDSSNVSNQRSEMNGRKLEKEESLDWKKLMAEDLHPSYLIERSPVKYLMEDMHTGHSLKSTVTLGNERERERVYDTIFRLPWRCELLINVGFFVCMDSFLSLLTIMPMRMVMTLWRIIKERQFKWPSAAELSDFGCFLVLISGVTLLQQTDISLIYHMIRGQGIIKLYVVYNVLEIFDKLCQSFVGDVMQTLFNSADGLANCSPENLSYWRWRFVSDEILAMASSIVHSFILLAQAVTLSTCIVAHNNALFALLVSNNFAEIKSNVFKRFSKDNIHSIVYADSVERFHILAFLLFVLAQNILEAEGPWFENFITNALVVYICELLIDIIKHSFIAKFNEIKPIAYSEFLEDLSKQTLNIQAEPGKRKLIFIPVAPACLVIRVLRPVYAAHLPYNPLPWRLFWIFLLAALTFVMLASLKVMVSMGLKKHARWYVKRCETRKIHTD